MVRITEILVLLQVVVALTKRMSAAITNFISANFPDKGEEELEIIGYGLEGIISLIFKTILIFIIGYSLKIILPLALAITSFGLLRMFASGVHLRKSLSCFVFSSLIFLAITYAGIYIQLSYLLKIAMFAVTFILLLLYAPADTEERPLINKKTRFELKMSSLAVAGIMFFIVMILPFDNTIGNIITWSAIIESVMTTPMIYYFFNRRYQNYENYES